MDPFVLIILGIMALGVGCMVMMVLDINRWYIGIPVFLIVSVAIFAILVSVSPILDSFDPSVTTLWKHIEAEVLKIGN